MIPNIIKAIKERNSIQAEQAINKYLSNSISFMRTILDHEDYCKDRDKIIPRNMACIRDEDGKSALHLAVEQGNYKLVDFLLKHGMKPDISYKKTNDDNGEIDITPKDIAAAISDTKMIELLSTPVKYVISDAFYLADLEGWPCLYGSRNSGKLLGDYKSPSIDDDL
ncbi:MAG: Ankyrin repeat (many copies) [Rickettsiaceae bacterium]|jgi:ankyrin repeat protein|nr:Ankyrin repeat (many copies) [Rickettsiaceae bacterium]